MRLDELLAEAPVLKNTELVVKDKGPKFISNQALKDRWNVIDRGRLGQEFCVALKKRGDKTGIIGIPGKRADDGADGIIVYGYVDFRKPTLSGLKEIKVPSNALQVAIVHINEKQAEGWGLQLYASIATQYSIISDNTLYIGGKALWKRIAQSTLNNKYQVHVLDDGDVRLDADGKPVKYDGSNIDDADLWSEDNSKKYTLFVLSAT